MYGSIPVSQFLSPKVFSSLVCLINFKTVFFNVIYHHFWSMLHTHVSLFTFVIQMHQCICAHVIYPCIVHIGTFVFTFPSVSFDCRWYKSDQKTGLHSLCFLLGAPCSIPNTLHTENKSQKEKKTSFHHPSVAFFSQVTLYSMYVSIMAFNAKVSDPLIGGTYMTLLNTVSNLGGNWPSTVALWLVDPLTVKECVGASNQNCRTPDAIEVSVFQFPDNNEQVLKYGQWLKIIYTVVSVWKCTHFSTIMMRINCKFVSVRLAQVKVLFRQREHTGVAEVLTNEAIIAGFYSAGGVVLAQHAQSCGFTQ